MEGLMDRGIDKGIVQTERQAYSLTGRHAYVHSLILENTIHKHCFIENDKKF